MPRLLMLPVLLVLLLVACQSAPKGLAESPVGAAVGDAVQSHDTEKLILLEQKVAELESRLDDLMWTETDAINVVKLSLSLLTMSCVGDRSFLCAEYERNYLMGSSFAGGIPAFFASTVFGSLIRDTEWSAFRDPDLSRWRVLSMSPHPDGASYTNFHVYERTGLVEGAARTPSERLGDAIRENESQR